MSEQFDYKDNYYFKFGTLVLDNKIQPIIL